MTVWGNMLFGSVVGSDYDHSGRTYKDRLYINIKTNRSLY